MHATLPTSGEPPRARLAWSRAPRLRAIEERERHATGIELIRDRAAAA